MALLVNGVEINAVNLNGTALEKVNFNGVTVFEAYKPEMTMEFNGVAGTVTWTDGTMTATRGSTGFVAVTFTTAMPNTNYIIIARCGVPPSSRTFSVDILAKTASGFTVRTAIQTGGGTPSNANHQYVYITVIPGN